MRKKGSVKEPGYWRRGCWQAIGIDLDLDVVRGKALGRASLGTNAVRLKVKRGRT